MNKTALVLLFVLAVYPCMAEKPESILQTVIDDQPIEFATDSNEVGIEHAGEYLDNHRLFRTVVPLPAELQSSTVYRVTCLVKLSPKAKDNLSVHDPWDRAANVRLEIPGKPDVELVKYITAYGGETSYEVDISHLQPLLQDSLIIKGFVDTWVKDGWTLSVDFRYEALEESNRHKLYGDWVEPLWFAESVTTELSGDSITVIVPDSIKKVFLYYYVSGHCTDGRDEDEFISKDNVLRIDATVIYRYQPWRDDCKQFRSINPYTKRWSDGYWSSDFSRSGWCPGDLVEPLVLDLTDHLTPGKHEVSFDIENIRPKDEKGNYGYWRVSGYLVGYTHTDVYQYNEW